MAEDIKYTVAEMEQLAKTVEKLKGEFGKDFEQVFTNINVLLKEWNKSFGMGTSEMEELLSISDELREKHDQMVDLGKKYAAELEKISNLKSDFLRDNGISIEQAKEIVRLKGEEASILDKYSQVKKELNRIEEDLKNTSEARLIVVNKIKQLEDEANKLGEGSAVEYQKKLHEIEKLTQVVNKYDKAMESLQDEENNQKSLLQDLDDEYNNIAQKVNSYNDAQIASFQTAIQGYNQAIQNVQDYSVGLQNATDQTAELAKATAKWNRENDEARTKIIGAAKEVWGTVKKIGTEVLGKYGEIDHAVVSFGRTVGLSTQAIKAHKASILDQYDDMASRLGMTFEEMFKFQEQYTRNTGRAVILTNQQIESLAEMSKLTSAESVEKMTSSMDEFGASTETATDYLALNMARARSQGLDAAKASEAFANNIKMASRYSFQEGINGVSKMTLLSQRLKFNMESISSSLDKFSTIEGAIETSANIQMLGGSYAMNFSNPLDAMGEALMDAEGFINRIVDTVSTQATFNRQTGMVEMSGFEKARLREFSKQMGLNYDDTWNMVAQQTKIQAMSRELGQGKWSETEEALIANKAQFNAEKNRWEIALPGHDTPTAITDLTSSMLEELKDVAALTDEDLKGDVRHIRQDLRKFIDKTVETNKSWKEWIKGWKENTAITLANGASKVGLEGDFRESMMENSNNGGGVLEPLLYGGMVISTGVNTYMTLKGGKQLKGLANKGIGMMRGRKHPKPSLGSTAQATPAVNQSGGGLRGGALPRGANFKKSALKGAKGGGAIGAAMLAIEGAQSWYNFQQNKEAIENSNLTQEQKNAALADAKQERNKGYAQAAGGAIGSVIGGALLSWIPVVGTALGATLGGMAGSAIGGWIVDGNDKSSATSMTTIENTEIQNATEQLALLTSIDTSVSEIVKNRSQLTERVLAMSSVRTNDNHIVNKSQIGETTTYFNQNGGNVTTHNSKLKHDLNVSGTIKLQGEKGEQASIDVKKLLENNQFVTSVTDMIVAQLNMRSGQGGRVNKDTTQYRLGGAQSPENQNLTTTSLA